MRERTDVCGRFAPSPSGRMHLGNVFCAVLAWLSARSRGGRFLLRIEDLDVRRCKPEHARLLEEDLAWLGLEWDEGPYYQHDRLDLYESALRRLKDAGLTYPCFCTRAELHAASAPHASDGTPIYRGACRSLSAEEVARRSAGYVLLYQIPAWFLYAGLRKIFRDAGEREKTE